MTFATTDALVFALKHGTFLSKLFYSKHMIDNLFTSAFLCMCKKQAIRNRMCDLHRTLFVCCTNILFSVVSITCLWVPPYPVLVNVYTLRWIDTYKINNTNSGQVQTCTSQFPDVFACTYVNNHERIYAKY